MNSAWNRKHFIQQDQIKLMMLLILQQQNNSRNIRIIPFDVDFWMCVLFFRREVVKYGMLLFCPFSLELSESKRLFIGIMLS